MQIQDWSESNRLEDSADLLSYRYLVPVVATLVKLIRLPGLTTHLLQIIQLLC